MSLTITHPFVSAIADSGNTSLVQPSDWNDDHTVVGDATATSGYVLVGQGAGSAPIWSSSFPGIITFPDGTFAAPSIAFTSTPTLGFYLLSSSIIGATGQIRVTGSSAFFIGLTLISTDASATAGPVLVFARQSVTPANLDDGGSFAFTMYNSNLVSAQFGAMGIRAVTVTAGAEDGSFEIQTIRAGALVTRFAVNDGISIGTLTAAGSGMIRTNSASFMIRTSTSYNNGAAAGAGTLTNAPAAGDPTKWIPVDDNGTTRYIPAW